MNHKNARIGKLHSAGLTPEQIARKIGLQGLSGLDRVLSGLDMLRRSGSLVEPAVKPLDKSTAEVVD